MDLYNLKFVYVYFFIQFLAIIINSIIFLGLLVLCFIINALMHDMPRTFNDMLQFYLWSSFIIILYIAYFACTLIATIATKNKIDNKPLTKFQKICVVIFPIITVPLYLYILIKVFL